MIIQRVAALMLSMALTFSTCMPLNGITALGAETGNMTVEASEQEEVSYSADSTELQQEEDTSSETDIVEITAPEEEDSSKEEAASEEETVSEEDEAVDDQMEDSDKAEAVDTLQEEKTVEGSESRSDEEVESAVPAQETNPSSETDSKSNGRKSDSTAEQSPAAEETVSAEYNFSSDDGDQKLRVWPDGEPEEVSTKVIQVLYCESTELKVNVSAPEDSTLTYMWYWNGGKIEGNNTNTFTTDPITGKEEYQCVVSDQYENTASVYFNLSVINNFTAGTLNGVIGAFKFVSYGDSVELEASASADDESALTYSWYLNGEKIEGNNEDHLTTGPVTENRIYICDVRDQYGNKYGVSFDVCVENNFKAWPNGENEDSYETDSYFDYGMSFDLKVNVSADDVSDISYTWYLNGEEIEGSNSDTLATDSITGNWEYECDVRDRYGNIEKVLFHMHPSRLLRAWPDGELEGETKKNVYVLSGESAELKVKVLASEDSTLSYYWYLNGKKIEGNNSDTLKTEPINGYREYFVEVRDQDRNKARVYFYVHVGIKLNAYVKGEEEDTDSITIGALPGQSLDLEVNVTANEGSSLSKSWLLDDEVIATDTLSLHTDPIYEVRDYEFRVQDQYGNRASVDFYIYVENNLKAYPADADEDSDNKEYRVEYNESKDLKVVVTADDKESIYYTWYRNGEEIPGNNKDTLTTGPITDNQYYELDVNDKYGNICSVFFTIYIDNHLKAYPDGEDEGTDSTNVYVASGQSAELKACVSADNMEDLTYRWYVQITDSDGYKWFGDVDGTPGLSFNIGRVTEDQVYRFRVEDQYGNHKDAFFYVFLKAATSGWVEEGGERYYYTDDGTKLTNGWAKDGSTWYWMDSSGKITKNQWVQSGDKWYYMNANGVMTTGWQQIDGKWYYMDNSGAMATGWQQIGGKWYYMNSSGAMTTGWQQIGGKWYYMNPSGVMMTGWQQIGGKWYYMNPSGVMTTGWQQVGGKWYYMNPSGVMTTGWQQVGGKWYYMNSSGVMTTGWQQIGGKWYYMNSSGVMTTGWQQIGGKWYYMGSSGVMVTGWQTIGGKRYYFNSSGVWEK